MKTIQSRIASVEARVAALPIPRGVGPMEIDEFLSRHADLWGAVEFQADRLMGYEGWYLGSGTFEVSERTVQALVEAVAAEDEKARGGPRPLPSSGVLGELAKEAKRCLEEPGMPWLMKVHQITEDRHAD